MSSFIWQTAYWLSTAAAASAFIYIIRVFIIRLHHGRTQELLASRRALDEYKRAIQLLLGDPATPESMRNLLREFDRGVMRRRAAYFVAFNIFHNQAEWLTREIEEPKVLVEMRALGKDRPDLYKAFVTAVATGFAATMLRWLFPARALSLLLVDPRRDPLTPARVVARGAEKGGIEIHFPKVYRRLLAKQNRSTAIGV
jgi:hypothetical protein